MMIVDVLTPKDVRALDRFRGLCSKKHAPFLRKNGFNKVKARDLVFPNLLLKENGKIIASLRMEVLWSWSDFDFRYDSPRFIKRMKFPCLYINHVYTHPDQRKRGLNTLLRYVSFRLAKKWKMRSVLGDMLETSPRVRTLKEMGYNAYPHPKGWSVLGTDEKVLTLYLDFETKGREATLFCRKLSAEPLKKMKLSKKVMKLKAPKATLKSLLVFEETLQVKKVSP